MRTACLLLFSALLLLLLPACKKEEQPEPKPAAPTTRQVRYEVTCAGAYYFGVRLNGESGTFPLHSGDTTATLQLAPGTVIQVAAGNATAAITGKLWVNGALREEMSAPASLGIYLSDTIP